MVGLAVPVFVGGNVRVEVGTTRTVEVAVAGGRTVNVAEPFG